MTAAVNRNKLVVFALVAGGLMLALFASRTAPQAAQAADSRMPWLVGTSKRKPGTQEVST